MEDTDTRIEENFDDLNSLNKCLCLDDILCLHLNVRCLNVYFENLELFIHNLCVKPDVIICSETWILPCFTFFAIDGYDCFYNHSYVSKADGVVMYIKKSLQSSATIEEFDNLRIISAKFKLSDNKVFKISGVYRCHDLIK